MSLPVIQSRSMTSGHTRDFRPGLWRRSPLLLILALVAGLYGATWTDLHAAEPGEHSAISVGEELVFAVKWGIVNAGTATMSVTERKKVSGQDCFHVVASAVSNPVFDKIYPVRDRFESFMDAGQLHSWAFKKHLREGKFRRDQVVRTEATGKTAHYHDGKTYDIAPGAFDILSAFYFVRTLPLTPGQEIALDTHSNRKNYTIAVTVLKKERIEVPAGSFDCIVVESRLQGGDFFQGDGELIIWLTDDERRMPVQMKSKIPVGSIAVVLKEFRRGGNQP